MSRRARTTGDGYREQGGQDSTRLSGDNFRLSFTPLPKGPVYKYSASFPWPRIDSPGRLQWEGCTLTAQFPLPGDLLHNFHLTRISCSPQCTQYLVPPRLLIACFSSLHPLMRMASLTTAPQNEQKRTGAFARLWLKLVHLFPCIIILRSLSIYDYELSGSSVFLSLSFFSQMVL